MNNQQSERWLPVVGYEGVYEVSDLGRVRSLDRIDALGRKRTGRLLAPGTYSSGHRSVVLCRDGSEVTARVHRLVLDAFVGPCPPGMQACHHNDVPGDNQLSNLRWDTQSGNQLDRVRNGIHNHAMKTRCPSGHPYDETNTYRDPGGNRHCRTCVREAGLRWRVARRAA